MGNQQGYGKKKSHPEILWTFSPSLPFWFPCGIICTRLKGRGESGQKCPTLTILSLSPWKWFLCQIKKRVKKAILILSEIQPDVLGWRMYYIKSVAESQGGSEGSLMKQAGIPRLVQNGHEASIAGRAKSWNQAHVVTSRWCWVLLNRYTWDMEPESSAGASNHCHSKQGSD